MMVATRGVSKGCPKLTPLALNGNAREYTSSEVNSCAHECGQLEERSDVMLVLLEHTAHIHYLHVLVLRSKPCPLTKSR